jgi:hypothetical protein
MTPTKPCEAQIRSTDAGAIRHRYVHAGKF